MSDNQYAEWKQQSGNKHIEDPRERMLSKLRKLLSMQGGAATEAESAIAAAQLQRFLTEHNLSVADLEAKGAAAPQVGEQAHDLGKAAFKWKLDLAEGIAEFYYCAPLVNRTTKTVKFAGRPENVESLTMLYQRVIDQIKAIATTERRAHFDKTQEHIDPLRWQLGFGEGAAERLIERLRELKARQAEDMSRDEYGNVTALAMHHQSEVSDYLEEKFGYRTDGKKTKWERENAERWARERAEKDELRIRCEESGDMEPYYEAYSWERPDTPAEKEAAAKQMEKYLKEEARKERRRKGSSHMGPAIDYDKRAQMGSARDSGRSAAGKVNLQPFLSGAADRKKVG